MGRKAKFDGTATPSGRGRKAKKQGDPTFPKGILVKDEQKLSHRQKQRAKKRLLKKQKLKDNIQKLKKDRSVEGTENTLNGVKKTTAKQLKQKKSKKAPKPVPVENGAADESSEMELSNERTASDSKRPIKNKKKKPTKKKLIQEELEEESDELPGDTAGNLFSDDSDMSDEDEEMEQGEEEEDLDEEQEDEEDEELPIEKANKKLKKKQEREQ